MCLTVEQHPCWFVTCDVCGDGDNSEYGGYYHHATEADAATSTADEGTAYCIVCELRGELACLRTERDRYREALKEIARRPPYDLARITGHRYSTAEMFDAARRVAERALKGETT